MAPSSQARRDPVKRNTDILHDSFKGDKYLAIKTNSWKAWLRNSTYNTAGGFRLVNGPPIQTFLAALEEKGCLGDITNRIFIITQIFKAKLFYGLSPGKKTLTTE